MANLLPGPGTWSGLHLSKQGFFLAFHNKSLHYIVIWWLLSPLSFLFLGYETHFNKWIFDIYEAHFDVH